MNLEGIRIRGRPLFPSVLVKRLCFAKIKKSLLRKWHKKYIQFRDRNFIVSVGILSLHAKLLS